jgi:hypothetical protein
MTSFGPRFNQLPHEKRLPPKAEPATVENIKRLSEEADAYREATKVPAKPVILPRRDGA